MGNADGGHYYSFINIQKDQQIRSKKINSKDKIEDKWLEFNDSLVKDFDIKNLEHECFGG